MLCTTGIPCSFSSGSPKSHFSPFRTIEYSFCIVAMSAACVLSRISAYLTI
jgi:hypothetical protein